MEYPGALWKYRGSEHCVTPLDPLPSALRHDHRLHRLERASSSYLAQRIGHQH